MGAGDSVTTECWVLLVIVLLVYVCRMISRRILLTSWKKLQIDDYLMTFVICNFIIVVVSVYTNIIWGNNYLTAEQAAAMTPHEIYLAKLGSKWAVAMEVCKVTTVWGCKACLLILYAHMTKGLPQYHRAVMAVAVYVAIGYIVVIVCYFVAWCKPFSAYWDVIPLPPGPQQQCTTYRNHMINDAVWNISSDFVMLCLPIPLVVRSQIPMKRKLVLVGVFSLGGLVILCAALNRITNFTAPYGSLVYLNWYVGETTTAVIVANAPHLWPLISRVFGLGSFKQTNSSGDTHQFRLASGTHASNMRNRRNIDKDGYIRSESEERIAVAPSQWNSKSVSEGDLEMGGYTVGVAASGKEGEHAWNGGQFSERKDHIVKTVDMKQYSEND